MGKRDERSGTGQLARALRGRLSYANVTATLALFVALAGGSFAVAELSGQERKAVKKIAKRQANKRITARAPDLSVKRAKSAGSATNADQATSADSATNAANAELLDGLGPAAFQRRGKGVDLTGSTAPSVAGLSVLGLVPSSPTAIVTLSDGVEGQLVTLVAGNAGVSATDSAFFDLNGDWTGVGQGDTLTVIFFEGGWQEVSRSDN